MKKLKVIVKEFKRKDGGTFTKITAKGKYIPLLEVESDVDYTIKFVGEIQAPTKSGVWSIGCEDNGLWLDSRPEYLAKNIVRVRATKILFDKVLPNKSSQEVPF